MLNRLSVVELKTLSIDSFFFLLFFKSGVGRDKQLGACVFFSFCLLCLCCYLS